MTDILKKILSKLSKGTLIILLIITLGIISKQGIKEFKTWREEEKQKDEQVMHNLKTIQLCQQSGFDTLKYQLNKLYTRQDKTDEKIMILQHEQSLKTKTQLEQIDKLYERLNRISLRESSMEYIRPVEAPIIETNKVIPELKAQENDLPETEKTTIFDKLNFITLIIKNKEHASTTRRTSKTEAGWRAEESN